MYADCRAALAKSVKECGRPKDTDEYRRCMRDRADITVLPAGETCDARRTPCVLSSDDATFCASCARPTAEPQTVHAVAGMYGGPSRVEGTHGTREKSPT